MGMLRLLLAVSVVLVHTDAAYTFAGGRIAVQMFYMISGFLISYILRNKAYRGSKVRFYGSRLLRILPIYYIAAAGVFLLLILQRTRLQEFRHLPASLQAFLAVVNVTVLGQDWTNFVSSPGLPLHKFLLIPQAWTLGVELSFYAVAPFILGRTWMMVAVFLLSISARLWGASLGLTTDPWTYRFFPFELALFMAGALSARHVLPRVQQTRLPIVFGALTMVALSGLISAEPMKSLALFGALFFVLPYLFRFNRSWDAFLGELSYPVYLTHWAVAMVTLEVLQKLHLGRPWYLWAIVLPVTLLVSLALARVVQEPVDRLRARLRQADKSVGSDGLFER